MEGCKSADGIPDSAVVAGAGVEIIGRVGLGELDCLHSKQEKGGMHTIRGTHTPQRAPTDTVNINGWVNPNCLPPQRDRRARRARRARLPAFRVRVRVRVEG